MKTVAVIDYGMGNLHSVAKALEHVSSDTKVLVSSDPATILKADRVILPGVGAIRDCVAEIRRLGFDEVVAEVAQQKPLLGICVGMQALLEHSEENDGVECLALLPGKVKHFQHLIPNPGTDMKIPHMGWNQVQHQDHALWHNIEQASRFYFVHSYFVECELAIANCNYGGEFCAAIAKENIFAVQFHPEKSQRAGLQLLSNFLTWNI